MYKDYNTLVESMKQTSHEKQRGSRGHHGGAEMPNGKDENVEIVELSTKLRRAQEEVEMEKLRVDHVTEKVRRGEADLETIPLLRAQVKNFELEIKNSFKLVRTSLHLELSNIKFDKKINVFL